MPSKCREEGQWNKWSQGTMTTGCSMSHLVEL